MPMPHRLASFVEPLAMWHTAQTIPAYEAICARACRDTAMTVLLVAQGIHPHTADHMVKSWSLTGMFVHPEIRGYHPGVMRAMAPGITGMVPGIAAAWPGMAGVMPGLIGREVLGRDPIMY